MLHLVVIAWLYVALMMAVAEATHPNGTLLGAALSFVLYGLGPLALVIYLMNTTARRRAMRDRERATDDQSALTDSDQALSQPDGSGHPPATAQGEVIPAMRKEP